MSCLNLILNVCCFTLMLKISLSDFFQYNIVHFQKLWYRFKIYISLSNYFLYYSEAYATKQETVSQEAPLTALRSIHIKCKIKMQEELHLKGHTLHEYCYEEQIHSCEICGRQTHLHLAFRLANTNISWHRISALGVLWTENHVQEQKILWES